MSKGFGFSTCSPIRVVTLLFGYGRPSGCEVGVNYFLVVWICISLETDDAEQLSMCLLAIRVSSQEQCLFRPFARFFLPIDSSFCYSALHSEYRSLIRHVICKYFLPFCELSVFFLVSFVCKSLSV